MRRILESIAAGDLAHDRFALNVAGYDLARLAAKHALGEHVADTTITELETRFNDLGSPYFARIARSFVAESRVDQRAATLTRREREITALVAAGLTNREIAERLVLSERTVEAHIANVFAKVGASSRSQIAVWHARSASQAP